MDALKQLANELMANHAKENGCLVTHYGRISGLKVLASTTNGTSGLGVYRGSRVYWHLNSGMRFDSALRDLVKYSEPYFEVNKQSNV
jgi:hypothetical protein